MPSSSRIIAADELENVAPWSFGRLTPERSQTAGTGARSSGAAADAAGEPPEQDERSGFEIGFRNGYQKGYQEGLRVFQEQSQAEAQALSARLDGLAHDFRDRLQGLEQALADEVVDLALEVARQTVRSVVRARPEALRPVIEEALAALIEDRSRGTLHLHPDDEAALRDSLAPLVEQRGLRLVADASIAAGGCRIDSADARVDATLQTRWRRAIEALGRSGEWLE